MTTACPYCGRTDCDERAWHIECLTRTRAQDRAAFSHFTRHLPIKRDAA